MYSLTQSVFNLGFVGLVQFVPMVFLTLVVGHIADRFDRRKIVFTSRIIEGIVASFLLLENLDGALSRDKILLAAALIGACRAFENPTSSALLPQLMPKELIPPAITWSTSANQISQIIGPSLGGLLFSLGADLVYGTTALALFAAGILTYLIQVEERSLELKRVSLNGIFSGLVFVYRHPTILGTISLDLFAVLFGGATALLPVFAQDILHTGAFGLGLMRTAPAIGALIMSAILVYFPLRKSVGLTLFGSVTVYGLSTMLFAISQNLILSFAALLIIGASDVVSVVIRSSIVQLQTPDEMRGRVNAVNSLFIGTSNQLGEFESGMVAGFIGAVPAAFIGGLGTAIVVGLWMYLFPSLRRMQSLSER